MNIDFPFHIDNRQRTAVTSDNDHIRDLIEQLVLTGPGERVNRPDFGGGLQQLVFAGNSPELAATVQFMIQGNLQQYLGDLIDVASVQVDAVDSTLQVVVAYVVRRTAERRIASFSSSLGQGR
jgi:phage baseplate assembly protein W